MIGAFHLHKLISDEATNVTLQSEEKSKGVLMHSSCIQPCGNAVRPGDVVYVTANHMWVTT